MSLPPFASTSPQSEMARLTCSRLPVLAASIRARSASLEQAHRPSASVAVGLFLYENSSTANLMTGADYQPDSGALSKWLRFSRDCQLASGLLREILSAHAFAR